MPITPEMVRELREKTGAGMMDCKKALTESGGDLEKAVDYLRTKGLAAAAKKAGRIASEGLVAAHVVPGAGALVEVNCETDFVAKTEDFRAFAGQVAALVCGRNPADAGAALALPTPEGPTLSETLAGKVARIGEKISLRRFVRFEIPSGTRGIVVPYIHAGGKIGVLIEVHGATPGNAAFAAAAKDLAMQVAAASPSYVDRAGVPAEAVARERAIYREQALAAGKPEKIVDRIADGKLEKFYGDFCLLEQAFIRDPDRKVRDRLREVSAAVGAEVRPVRFTRFQVGEGMEKRSDDLAAEVARQLGQG